MTNWIPCSQRLPDAFTSVLATDGSTISTAQRRNAYCGGSDWSIDNVVDGNEFDWALQGRTITHWMPLPKLPCIPPREERG
jgi:hypothetical protein